MSAVDRITLKIDRAALDRRRLWTLDQRLAKAARLLGVAAQIDR